MKNYDDEFALIIEGANSNLEYDWYLWLLDTIKTLWYFY